MAANGLINGRTPPDVGMGQVDFDEEAWQREPRPGGIRADARYGSFPQGGWEMNVGNESFGAPQFDEGVDQIAQAFKTYLTNNPHADRNAPNIDTFDAFRAGVEFGRTPPVEEFGKPYVPPNVDEFEGIATEGTPGNVNPDYRQQPPSSFSLDPNDPRNAHLNQGIPGQMQPTEDFRIDMSDILGTPRG
jgi:hypothetical protein